MSNSADQNKIERLGDVRVAEGLCPRLYHNGDRKILRVIIQQMISAITMAIINITVTLTTVKKQTLCNMKHMRTINSIRDGKIGSGYSESTEKNSDANKCFSNTQEERFANTVKTEYPMAGTSKGYTPGLQQVNKPSHLFTIQDFIVHLCNALRVDIDMVNETVNSILTTSEVIIVDFDINELTKRTASNIDAVVRFMTDIFEVIKHRMVIPVQFDGEWNASLKQFGFCPYPAKVGHIDIPPEKNLSYNKTSEEITEITESQIIDWYLCSYFYPKRDTFEFLYGYVVYLLNHFHDVVENPRVQLFNDNLLEQDVHLAHFSPTNFQPHIKLVCEYMRKNGIFHDPSLSLKHELPYILRSKNTVTQKSVFHIIYEDHSKAMPDKEHFFKSMVLLRDILLKLGLKQIAILAISCRCMFPNNGLFVKMVKYIFLKTDISITICDSRIDCSKST